MPYLTSAVLGAALCCFAFLGLRARFGGGSLDDYVTARNSQTASTLGLSFLGFFVTSCGFGLIEQAAHWAANQVDHGDEVGLVPVAACA